jgi:hypothetical protein
LYQLAKANSATRLKGYRSVQVVGRIRNLPSNLQDHTQGSQGYKGKTEIPLAWDFVSDKAATDGTNYYREEQ